MAKSTSLKVKQSAASYRQVAAIPVRERDGVKEVCLVTTRGRQRWTVPKGWPMRGREDSAAAAIEAREEAGLKGEVSKQSIGSYLYWKRRNAHFALIEVAAYRLDVSSELDSWRERHQRRVCWFTPDRAAKLVHEPALSALIEQV